MADAAWTAEDDAMVLAELDALREQRAAAAVAKKLEDAAGGGDESEEEEEEEVGQGAGLVEGASC